MARVKIRVKKSKARRDKNRRGAVAVEFAICASILFLFTFAGIEFARVNMIRNSIENAAYEGARAGILPGSTSGECQVVAEDMLTLVGIDSYTLNVSAITSSSDSVTVTVQVPLNMANGYVTPKFFIGKTLTASVTLPREKI